MKWWSIAGYDDVTTDPCCGWKKQYLIHNRALLCPHLHRLLIFHTGSTFFDSYWDRIMCNVIILLLLTLLSDITLELRGLGVPWSLHAWTMSLAAAADAALDHVIDQLLQDFLQVTCQFMQGFLASYDFCICHCCRVVLGLNLFYFVALFIGSPIRECSLPLHGLPTLRQVAVSAR